LAEDFMEQDHAALGALFRHLDLTLGEGDTIRALDLLDLAWARLAVHIRGEHLHLFPAILNALVEDSNAEGPITPSPGEAREAISRLREDHNFFMHELADAVKIMRALSRAAPDASDSMEQMGAVRRKVAEIAKRLEVHNQLEETEVYLWPSTILGPEAQNRLDDSLRRELENMPPRFEEN
jgi:hypothetical protein